MPPELGVFALYAYGDMTRILPQIPGFGALGWDMFGAANLTNRITTALSLTPVAGLVLKAVCVAGAAVIALRLAVSAEMGAGLSKLTDAETLFLLAGAALIVGCFFAGPSIGYRGVLLLLALPGLMALRRAMPGRIQRLGLSLALAASLLVMCLGSEIMLIRTVARWIGADDDTIGMALTVEWIVSQAAWWWLATTLLSSWPASCCGHDRPPACSAAASAGRSSGMRGQERRHHVLDAVDQDLDAHAEQQERAHATDRAARRTRPAAGPRGPPSGRRSRPGVRWPPPRR